MHSELGTLRNKIAALESMKGKSDVA
jgi:hypothetical protein